MISIPIFSVSLLHILKPHLKHIITPHFLIKGLGKD